MDAKETYYRKIIPSLRAFFNNDVDLEGNGVKKFYWNPYEKRYVEGAWGGEFEKFSGNVVGGENGYDVIRFSPTRAGVVERASNTIWFFWASDECTDLPIGKRIYCIYYVCRNFPTFVPIIDRSDYVLNEAIANAENKTDKRYNQFFKDGKEVLESQFRFAFSNNLKTEYILAFDETTKEIKISPDNLIIKGR